MIRLFNIVLGEVSMKKLTHVKCIVPFTRFEIYHHAYCYTCCPGWSKIGNVGKLTTDLSIMDIWNNAQMQYLRKAILEDRLDKVCNYKSCPYAIKNENLNLEEMKNDDQNFNTIIDQIINGQTVLDTPPHVIQIANSGKCNLKCVMCQTNDKCQKDDDYFDEILYTKIIPHTLPGISRISLSGNGEVFFNPNSRRFLQTLDPNQYPNLKIELYTNAMMFTPKLWETIKHNHYDNIFVSIDAASKETYEKIRVNGKWDVLQQNLRFISELRKQNIFTHFCINFCVMKSNYHELREFAKLGLDLGCDRIFFQKVVGLADIRENINFLNNKKAFVEIANLLNDPIFQNPRVDTTVIDQYQKKYLGKSVSWLNRLSTTIKEWLFYFPTKLILMLTKKFSFITNIYLYFERRKVSVDTKALKS